MRRNVRIRRWSEFIVGLLFTFIDATFVLFMAAGGQRDETFAIFVSILVFGVVGLWFMGAVMSSKLVVDSVGVRVDNWFTRFWVPWSVVVDIEVEWGVSLVLADAEKIGLGVGGGSLLNQVFGNRFQYKVRERLEYFRAQATVVESDEAPGVVKRWRLGLRRLGLWAVAIFVPALPHLFGFWWGAGT